jgi:hypothetical protein
MAGVTGQAAEQPSQGPQPLIHPLVDRWLAIALAVVALGFAAFDAFVARPAMVALSRDGRRVTGMAIAAGAGHKGIPPHRGEQVTVDDPELGPQLVDGGGAVDGSSVEVLCSTTERRCERLAVVSAYDRWPRTPNMLRAAGLMVAAVIVALGMRRPRSPA